MKKSFLFILLLTLLMTACGSKTQLKLEKQHGLDTEEALKILRTTVEKSAPTSDFSYFDQIVSGDSYHMAHIWKNPDNRAYYIRYWSFDGDELKVQLFKDSRGKQYTVTMSNDGLEQGDCYGYSNSMPVPSALQVKIYWSSAYRQGCRNKIKYNFDTYQEAVLFAGALKYLFVDHKFYELLKGSSTQDEQTEVEQVVEPNETIKPITVTDETAEPNIENTLAKPTERKSVIESNTGRCSVDKILKMNAIGLTAEEIKIICK